MIVSFLLALAPIAWLIVALTVLRMPSHRACLISLALAAVLAGLWWHMPALNLATAVLEGVLNALWPICLVVVAALFTYNITVRTGAMEQIKSMLAGVSGDVRVLALLIGWGFGNFMEGMAGFGTAVAIPASMLVGIGVNPLAAVVGCLVVNSTPTAFGSVGVPTATLAAVTGLEVQPLSADIALIQCLLTFASPFFLVCICGGGVRALRGVIPLTLLASLSFVVPWFAMAATAGAELPDIVGAVCSMACIVAWARLRPAGAEPAESLMSAVPALDAAPGVFAPGTAAPGAPAIDSSPASDARVAAPGVPAPDAPATDAPATDAPSPSDILATASISPVDALKAWSPYILILVLLMGTSSLCPPIHSLIAGIKSSVVVYAGEGGATLSFSWVNTPGVMIFAAAIIGALIQGASLVLVGEALVDTLRTYWRTVLTICCVMSMAKVMGYAGMISDIAAVVVAATGMFYPLVSPLIGALGAFVTGSGTSTNVLFGSLQTQTAAALGLNPSWLAAANVMGAGIGKMICPQGIAIGASAVGLVGSEREIMGKVGKYFAFYLVFAGLICMGGVMLGL